MPCGRDDAAGIGDALGRVPLMRDHSVDVAIVGGGPAGLLAAARLAETGLEVEVLEEHSEIGRPTHCTGIVSLEVAEFTKLPEDMVLGRLSRARLYGPQGARADFVWGDEAEPILTIDRAQFDGG